MRSALSPYQYDLVRSLCTEHGAQLWLPDIDGPVASNSADHERIMMELLWQTAPAVPRGPPTGTLATTNIPAAAASSIEDTHIRHEQPAYESDPQV